MKRRGTQRGFTLAEMMIAMLGSTIVIGALLFSSIALQRSLQASESYASNQAEQRRLLDYLARDMRRAVGIGTTTTVGGSGGVKLSGATATIENTTSLILTLPGYYQSNSPGDANYDQPMSVVTANNYVDYGTGNQHAPGVSVIFRKEYLESEKCICFVRIENDVQSIVVRDADNLHLTVTMATDGRTGTVEVTFLSPRHGSETMIAMRDQILLRNIRLD
jgi:type II secretory pathway pseudopilin PulG